MRQSNTIFAAVAAACFVAATCWPSSAPAEDGHAAATQGALSEAEMAAALHEWAAIWQAEAPLDHDLQLLRRDVIGVKNFS